MKMKKYILYAMFVQLFVSCNNNRSKIPPDCFTYEDSINGIKYTMRDKGGGGLLIVGEVQVMLAPNGQIFELATKSLEDRSTRIYYFVGDRCKDEISHFYSFKNGLDGIAVFYKEENKIERMEYYEKDEEVLSKVEHEK